MKKLLLLTAAAAMACSASAQVTFNMTVDPSETWLGYINFYNLDESFAGGFAETNLATMAANFTSPTTLSLTPNTRLYDENTTDPFWVDQTTALCSQVLPGGKFRSQSA